MLLSSMFAKLYSKIPLQGFTAFHHLHFYGYFYIDEEDRESSPVVWPSHSSFDTFFSSCFLVFLSFLVNFFVWFLFFIEISQISKLKTSWAWIANLPDIFQTLLVEIVQGNKFFPSKIINVELVLWSWEKILFF